MKTLLFKFFLVLAGLILALMAAEQLLRMVGWEYRPLSVQVRDRDDARGFHLFNDDHFAYDPHLLWRPKSNFGIFNSQGLRGKPLAKVPPD